MASQATTAIWKTALLGASLVSSSWALEAGGITVHGSASLTGAYSDSYNYLGETADSFDLNVKELTVNGAHRFENGLRASAQVYAYDLNGYRDLVLDFANIDYSFNQKFGIRAGRNKLPQGLYGEVQDLDQVRTFASLPLNFYPRALRSMSAAYNGAAVYGNLLLHKLGSFDYQFGFGYMDNIAGDEPYARGISSLTRTTLVDLDKVYSAALTWNAPVEGLKFAYTFGYLPGIRSLGSLDTSTHLAAIGYDLSVPQMIDAAYGAGAWDYSGHFAGSPTAAEVDVYTNTFSVEYTWNKFVGAVEYKSQRTPGSSDVPALGQLNIPVRSGEREFYVQGTYQITDKLSGGLYFCRSDFNPYGTSTDRFNTTSDYAAATSYAVNDNWLLKLEVHQINGLGGLGKAGDINLNAHDQNWNYIVVKTTFSF